MEMAKRAKAHCVIRVDVCGSLNPEYPIGSVVIPPRALIGDGTSSYYIRRFCTEVANNPNILLDSKESVSLGSVNSYFPHEKLKQLIHEHQQKSTLNKEFNKININFASVWTTDALFCEQLDELSRWKALGAEVVDMETSIMYLLSQIYRIPTISIMGVTDLPGSHEFDLTESNKLHPEIEKVPLRAIEVATTLLPTIKQMVESYGANYTV
jgi:purine-nucleoside phosphorylase